MIKDKTYDDFFLLSSLSRVQENTPLFNERLIQFEKKLYNRFPRSCNDHYKVEVFLDRLEVPSLLYILGYSGAALIEIYAYLERFVIIFMPRMLTSEVKKQNEIKKLIERKSLNEFADTLVSLDIWNNADKEFVRKFKKIRDGIAHKNDEMLVKYFNINEDKIFIEDEISKKIKDIDCTEYIIETISLILKIYVKRRPGGRNAKAKGKTL